MNEPPPLDSEKLNHLNMGSKKPITSFIRSDYLRPADNSGHQIPIRDCVKVNYGVLYQESADHQRRLGACKLGGIPIGDAPENRKKMTRHEFRILQETERADFMKSKFGEKKNTGVCSSQVFIRNEDQAQELQGPTSYNILNKVRKQIVEPNRVEKPPKIVGLKLPNIIRKKEKKETYEEFVGVIDQFFSSDYSDMARTSKNRDKINLNNPNALLEVSNLHNGGANSMASSSLDIKKDLIGPSTRTTKMSTSPTENLFKTVLPISQKSFRNPARIERNIESNLTLKVTQDWAGKSRLLSLRNPASSSSQFLNTQVILNHRKDKSEQYTNALVNQSSRFSSTKIVPDLNKKRVRFGSNQSSLPKGIGLSPLNFNTTHHGVTAGNRNHHKAGTTLPNETFNLQELSQRQVPEQAKKNIIKIGQKIEQRCDLKGVNR